MTNIIIGALLTLLLIVLIVSTIVLILLMVCLIFDLYDEVTLSWEDFKRNRM